MNEFHKKRNKSLTLIKGTDFPGQVSANVNGPGEGCTEARRQAAGVGELMMQKQYRSL